MTTWGIQRRIKTLASGKRVKQTLRHGRVIQSKTMKSPKQTKSRQRLVRTRRRIGI